MFNYFNYHEIERILFDWKFKGYTIIDLLTSEECDLINEDLDHIRNARKYQSDKIWAPYEPYMHPHKDSELINKYFAHPKVIEVMELLLGDKVEGVQTWAYFKPPGELGRDAHQDGFYSQSIWNTIANVSIALDDTDESNGGLWTYEGSHRLPLLDIEVDEERVKTNPAHWKNERGKSSKMPDNHHFEKVYATLKKGQALLIHSHVVHGSDDNNTTDKFRRSLLSGYKTIGSLLRQGEHMKRVPVDVYKLREKYWNLVDVI
jgi:ectoine hydroxylase-related dioxygenase (phytanoyl-CoA dioxygenase family)